MAYLKGKTLFFTTSPRTPLKMIPEIELLRDNFIGRQWNKRCQIEYMEKLAQEPKFEGEGSKTLSDFSARDRVNRGPKSLGFVDLSPTIQITEQGYNFISGIRTEETLLRQLLKFQLPSPYHVETSNTEVNYNIKPYLEIIRLIYTLEKISFSELMLFGMQMTDFGQFDKIVDKINNFRAGVAQNKGRYKQYLTEVTINELMDIYEYEIDSGETATRESKDASLKKFLSTKSSNMRDYTDACFRYLRATGLVTISHKMKSLSITPEKIVDVEYILNTVDRQPCFITDEDKYKEYLFSSKLPVLYSDNKDNLVSAISNITGVSAGELSQKTVDELKDIKEETILKRKMQIIDQQVCDLKAYKLYNDIIDTYADIKADELYDIPLMLEWNTWRAMTMLDSGSINGNFRMDDFGQPMSTAPGNTADIICDYEDFALTVEVTMQSGQRQYETEGEPVARHLAKFKKDINKTTYCLFIAPKINEASIAHFFALHKMNISYYGGISVIVPIPLDNYITLVKNICGQNKKLTSKQLQQIFIRSEELANSCSTEIEWYESLQNEILSVCV